MFEQALRQKFRFDSPAGLLSVEDLWELPLQSRVNRANLDDIARTLHRSLKNGDDVSFVDKDRRSDATTQLKFDIVKHVIDVKIAENEAQRSKAENAAKKQRILAILADKHDESLKSMSTEELQKLVESL